MIHRIMNALEQFCLHESIFYCFISKSQWLEFWCIFPPSSQPHKITRYLRLRKRHLSPLQSQRGAAARWDNRSGRVSYPVPVMHNEAGWVHMKSATMPQLQVDWRKLSLNQTTLTCTLYLTILDQTGLPHSQLKVASGPCIVRVRGPGCKWGWMILILISQV